jgi:hypothetical protein
MASPAPFSKRRPHSGLDDRFCLSSRRERNEPPWSVGFEPSLSWWRQLDETDAMGGPGSTRRFSVGGPLDETGAGRGRPRGSSGFESKNAAQAAGTKRTREGAGSTMAVCGVISMRSR